MHLKITSCTVMLSLACAGPLPPPGAPDADTGSPHAHQAEPAPNAPPPGPRSLCDGEDTGFECTTSRGKHVALCIVPSAKPGAGIRYRFGTPQKVELTVEDGFSAKHIDDDNNIVSFSTTGAHYEVYESRRSIPVETDSGFVSHMTITDRGVRVYDVGRDRLLADVRCEPDDPELRLTSMVSRISP